jgi:hypothetical protein
LFSPAAAAARPAKKIKQLTKRVVQQREVAFILRLAA